MDEMNTNAGKWTLAVHGARSKSAEAEDLCSVCNEAIQKIIRPAQNEQEGGGVMTIGWIDRMAATKYCAWCQYLVKLFLINNSIDVGQCDERHRILSFMRLGCEKVLQQGLRLEWDLSVGFMTNEEVETSEEARSLAQTNLPQVNFSLDVESSSQLGHGLEEGEVLYHLGRTVEDEVPVEFLRGTFETCKTYHGEACEQPKHVLKRGSKTEEPPDLRFLRVIDVEQRCLVPLPVGGSYVSLSYTWSPEPYTSLLKENIRDLEIPGGIETDHLPPTIADAMAVVGRLGERYLWADRLCIIQNDPRDKRIQINQMDIVYRYATLTIVAAASSDGVADAGLPGVRPITRKTNQTSTTIQSLRFVETRSWLDETIQQSRWHSRAWTFQEHLLSKRHLVFTPTRAIFFCAKDTFPEDYIRRTCFHSYSNTRSPCCAYQAPDSSDDVHASGIASSPLAYEIMVRWYTARNLTVESDILKGVAGLLRTVTRETGRRFLCGMPMTNLIDHFLLWLPTGQSVRRGKNAFGLDFPSWSWAGWVGGATYTVSGDVLDGREKVVFDEEGMGLDAYKVLVSTGAGEYHEHEPEDIEDDVLLNLEWCKLSFTAPSAMVEVSNTVWGHFSDCEDSRLGDVSRCHSIFVDEKFAGMVFMHTSKRRQELEDLQGQPEDASKLGTKKVELIALSTTYHPWPVYFPMSKYSRDDANFYYTDKDGEQQDHLPFDTNVWDDEDPEMVNVMMIEWIDGLASRVGIGQVHSDAWETSQPQEKKITLG